MEATLNHSRPKMADKEGSKNNLRAVGVRVEVRASLTQIFTMHCENAFLACLIVPIVHK